MSGNVAETAVTGVLRWAATAKHRYTRPKPDDGGAAENDPAADYRAWLDRLSVEIARDRNTVLGLRRRFD